MDSERLSLINLSSSSSSSSSSLLLPSTMHSERVSLPLIHHHLMMLWNDKRKGDCCGRYEITSDGYYCKICDLFFHKICSDNVSKSIKYPLHSDHTLQHGSKPHTSCDLCPRDILDVCYHCEICHFSIHLYCTDKLPSGFIFHPDFEWHPSEGVSLPLIHRHLMIPWNDLRKGHCCGRFKASIDGYLCKICDLFFHKKCSDEASESIQHPSHSAHALQLFRSKRKHRCNLCRKDIVDPFYRCNICDFNVDLHCAKYPPPDVIDSSQTHRHKLTLYKDYIEFDCEAKCGKTGYGFSYKCHECDLSFHVDCVWHPSEAKIPTEVNHSHHSLHPLKLLIGQPPEYSDGKCRLCNREVDENFYHCSLCNFTLDMSCVLHPPPQTLLNLKAHNHQLTLFPRLFSFTCNACGLKGDRSPYICLHCDFFIHQNCLDLPRVIEINRHDHRIFRVSVIGVVNSVCGVCHKKVDWTFGGYSCQRCPGYVVHSKCATNLDVWNEKDLEGVPEKIEDIKPYEEKDGKNTIQHFSHKFEEKHYLRLNVNGILWEDKKQCNACNRPICLQSFYGCMDCDFILHQGCAQLPRRKRHAVHNDQLTLVTSKDNFFQCAACDRYSNGFAYQHEDTKFDVRCISISEPFVYPGHPHPLYFISPYKYKNCKGCKIRTYCVLVLKCIEDKCKFVLDLKCATLPQVVKHTVDDHPLTLSYGEKANGKYWCDICEEETDPETWFYTCKDNRASLHTKCVLGDFAGLRPRSTIKFVRTSYEVVLNNSMTRPFCRYCEKRCIYPIFLKLLGTSDVYFCSYICEKWWKIPGRHYVQA